jgi:hypothetical protein
MERIKSFLLYCTLTKAEYDGIRPLIWRRNIRIFLQCVEAAPE